MTAGPLPDDLAQPQPPESQAPPKLRSKESPTGPEHRRDGGWLAEASWFGDLIVQSHSQQPSEIVGTPPGQSPPSGI